MKYAFVNASVLDGSENMQPMPNMAVLVEDGVIKAIEPTADSFGDVKKIDLEGRWLMPGLINLHVHLPGSGMPSYTKKQNAKTVNFLMSNIVTRSVVYSLCYKFARTQLMSGVTTIRTPYMVVMKGKTIKQPKVKKFDYVETELDKLL